MNIRFSNKYLQKTARSAEQGFTIVELIVVIVVIAILASITLVAYNGIRDRAYNTKTISAVRSYVNILNTNRLLNGPIDMTGYPGHYYCLGSDDSYPANSHLSSKQCVLSNGFNATTSSEINDALKEYGSIDIDAVEIGDSSSGYMRGIVGIGNSTIWYFLRGADQDCPVGVANDSLSFGGDDKNTMCYYTFPDDVVKMD